jgi:hypothetical protein
MIIQIHIGRVYLEKDIKTKKDVALKLKVTQDLSSKLSHEYNVYQAISGLPRTPKVHWYGREEPYRVIILNRLGSTFEKTAQMSMLNINAIFSYATQIVHYFSCLLTIYMFMLMLIHPSFWSLSHCMINVMSTLTLNLTISC